MSESKSYADRLCKFLLLYDKSTSSQIREALGISATQLATTVQAVNRCKRYHISKTPTSKKYSVKKLDTKAKTRPPHAKVQLISYLSTTMDEPVKDVAARWNKRAEYPVTTALVRYYRKQIAG